MTPSPSRGSRGGEQGAGQVYLEQVWRELSFDTHIRHFGICVGIQMGRNEAGKTVAAITVALS